MIDLAPICLALASTTFIWMQLGEFHRSIDLLALENLKNSNLG